MISLNSLNLNRWVNNYVGIKMGKRTVLTCDLCDGSDMGEYLVLKGKKRWFGWQECGMERKKVFICECCQESIRSAAIQDRKLREKEKER